MAGCTVNAVRRYGAGLLALTLLSFVAAAPVAGQNHRVTLPGEGKVELPKGKRSNDDQDVRRAMTKLAACVMRFAPKRIPAYLATFPGSDKAHDAGQRMTSGTICLQSGEMTLKERVLRGAVYELSYRQKFASQAPDLAAVGSIDYSQGEPITDRTSPHIALRLMADCAVRADGSDARALLLTSVATPEEKASFAALMPHVSACIPEGKTISFSQSVLRGLIAEVLYRLSTTVPTASSAGMS
ncbi:hypothetical protein O4H52_18375 [Sphingomonadaceae bacterium G21617-S1]|nr:hypothetical protein [Sphingomonadaceae bacterium G21617-S1]